MPNIQTLLKAGVDTNHQLNMLQPSRNGNSGRFKDDLLNTGATPLLRGADIRQQSVLGPGPPADVEARSIETLGILIKAGADVNARIADTSSLTARIARTSTMTNREGQTALFFAVQSGRASVVRFLLEHGADVNAMGDSGKALLDAAKNNAAVVGLIRGAMRN